MWPESRTVCCESEHCLHAFRFACVFRRIQPSTMLSLEGGGVQQNKKSAPRSLFGSGGGAAPSVRRSRARDPVFIPEGATPLGPPLSPAPTSSTAQERRREKWRRALGQWRLTSQRQRSTLTRSVRRSRTPPCQRQRRQGRRRGTGLGRGLLALGRQLPLASSTCRRGRSSLGSSRRRGKRPIFV